MRLCAGDAVGGSAISVLKADSKESDSQISGNLGFRIFSGGWCNGVRRLHIRVQLFGVGYITSVVHLGYIVTLSNDSSILGLGGYIPGYGLPGILVMGGFPYREISQSIQQFVFDQEQRSSIGIDLEHQVQASSSKGACNGRGPLHLVALVIPPAPT
jgi:hypothetical protein